MSISPSQPSKRLQSSSARIGALATLPVFFDLNCKPVLLIGGSEAAAWKAELLAAAGAHLEVHAVEFCDEMLALAARVDLNDSIKLIAQPWSPKIFINKSLAVGDAETEGEAKAIFCAARAAGVPVNIIDKPAYCTFKFGSIVNRSPVVIGISTDGAAPVLGQVIRTRIEALLPASLAQWAQYAKDIRETVLKRFTAGTERRQFWARFSRLSFGPFAEDSAWRLVGSRTSGTGAGGVTILTVPPSDPDLLTLDAVRRLQNADSIYFGANVCSAIVDHARREAARHVLDLSNFSRSRIKEISRSIFLAVSGGENVVLLKTARQNKANWTDLVCTCLEDMGIEMSRADRRPNRKNAIGDRGTKLLMNCSGTSGPP